MENRDRVVSEALVRVVEAMERNQTRQEGNNGSRAMADFQKNDPPKFSGGTDPEGAQHWIREMEKIFRVMGCSDEQKVSFTTFKLIDEAELWWHNANRRMENMNTTVTWDVFKEGFLEKYFPTEIQDKKEAEFLALTQGNMSVDQYADRFEELSRYYPAYLHATSDRSKCVKFNNVLRPELKQGVVVLELNDYGHLVQKLKEYEEAYNERASAFRNFKAK